MRAAIVAIAAEQQTPAADDLLLQILVDGVAPALAHRDRADAARAAARTAADRPHRSRRAGGQVLGADAAARRAPTSRARRLPPSAARSTRRAPSARLRHACSARPAPPTSSTSCARSSPTRSSSSALTPHVPSARSAPRASPATSPRCSRDTSWWVRAAAKESLFLLGDSGLRSGDRDAARTSTGSPATARARSCPPSAARRVRWSSSDERRPRRPAVDGDRVPRVRGRGVRRVRRDDHVLDARRAAPAAAPHLREPRPRSRVVADDPGQRHRARLQRGARRRGVDALVPRDRLPRVRGDRRQRRLDRRHARRAPATSSSSSRSSTSTAAATSPGRFAACTAAARIRS